jgi:hypothetical protein
MPSISFAASSMALEDFLGVYEPGQATSWTSITGQTLLHQALGNGKPAARVAIADRLLDDGADAAAVFGPEQVTTLHVLLSQGTHDVPSEAPLLQRLLDGGADVNAVAGNRWGTPFQTLASRLKFSDEELAPFYDVLFARPDLDLLRTGKEGRSSLQSARLLAQGREDLVRRMEEYLRRHGQWTDDLQES